MIKELLGFPLHVLQDWWYKVLMKGFKLFIATVGDSSRMVGLVQLLLKSNAASSLIEDYAACLELRSEESQVVENSSDDPGVLILQVNPGGFYSSFPVW